MRYRVIHGYEQVININVHTLKEYCKMTTFLRRFGTFV